VGKDYDLKTAIVLGPKAMEVLTKLAKRTKKDVGEVLKRAIAMYGTIKRMEGEGYKPCMLKDRTARLLEEE
jgi:hypothetical protein